VLSECEELITIVKTTDICEAKASIPAHLRDKGITWYSMFDVWTYIAEGPIDENCPKCMELDAQDFQGSYLRAMFPDLVILDEDTIYPNVHMTLWGKDTCCKKGTLITTDKGLVPIERIKVGDLVLTDKGRFKPVIQLHKNFYKGKLHQIGESWLTGNHPVLTSRGWVRAANLNEFEYIINVKPMALAESEYSPTVCSKEGVFFGVNFPHDCISMAGLENFVTGSSIFSGDYRTVNFDSYFSSWNSEVNIENIHSIQWNNLYPSIYKSCEKNYFQLTKFSIFLNSLSSLYKKFMSSWTHNHTFMVGFNLMRSLFRRHFFPSHFSGFTGITPLYSSTQQSSNYNITGNFVSSSESLFTESFLVQGDNFVNWQVDSQGSICQSTSLLKHIYSKQFKGYVYNLSVAEDETYCIGENQTVVHNCKCILRRTNEPYDALDLYTDDDLKPYKKEK